MELLGEGNGSIVVGQLTSSVGIRGSERDAVVDVEDTGRSARRPDGGGGLDLILLGIDLAELQAVATLCGHPGGGL